MRPFRRAPILAPPRQSIDRADAVSDLRSEPPLTARSAERRPSGGKQKVRNAEAVGYSGSPLVVASSSSSPSSASEVDAQKSSPGAPQAGSFDPREEEPELRPWTASSRPKGDHGGHSSESPAAVALSTVSSSSKPPQQVKSSSKRPSISDEEYTSALKALRAQHEEPTPPPTGAQPAVAQQVSPDSDRHVSRISESHSTKAEVVPREPDASEYQEIPERVSEGVARASAGSRVSSNEADPSNEILFSMRIEVLLIVASIGAKPEMKKGWLQKRGDGVIRSFNKRYFVLDAGLLRYLSWSQTFSR